MTIRVEPLGRLCLVELLPLPPISSILVTPDRQEVGRQGIVKAVGPACTLVTVGQTVILNALTGMELDAGRLLDETAILGTVT